MRDGQLVAARITETVTGLKKNRPTKIQAKPRGWIYGAKWSNEPVEARACLVTIGVAPKDWWCAGMTGQERRAIEVNHGSQTVYIDNDNGWALSVFLRGLAPMPRFRFVPAFFVKDDLTSEIFYRAVAAVENV